MTPATNPVLSLATLVAITNNVFCIMKSIFNRYQCAIEGNVLELS